jgi:hypothetical protein
MIILSGYALKIDASRPLKLRLSGWWLNEPDWIS